MSTCSIGYHLRWRGKVGRVDHSETPQNGSKVGLGEHLVMARNTKTISHVAGITLDSCRRFGFYLVGMKVGGHHDPLWPDEHAAPLKFCHEGVDVCPILEPLLLRPLEVQIVEDYGLMSLIVILVIVPPFVELLLIRPRIGLVGEVAFSCA